MLVNTQSFNTCKNNDTRRRLRESMIDIKTVVAIVSLSIETKGEGS